MDILPQFCTLSLGRRLGNHLDGGLENRQLGIYADHPGQSDPFIKARVFIDAEAPLRSRLFAQNDNRGGFWTRLDYEYFPLFCFNCGRLGHGNATCSLPPPPPGSEIYSSSMSVHPHGILLDEVTFLPVGHLAVPRRGRGRGRFTWVHPRNRGGYASHNRPVQEEQPVDVDPWQHQAVLALTAGEPAGMTLVPPPTAFGGSRRTGRGQIPVQRHPHVVLPPIRISEVSSAPSRSLIYDAAKGKGKATVQEAETDDKDFPLGETSAAPPRPGFRMFLSDAEMEIDCSKRTASKREAEEQGASGVVDDLEFQPAAKRHHGEEEEGSGDILGTVEAASSEWPHPAE
ncbi:unnamed protein product [Linum trigynum]|uniref:CCHC-type domain-containing protein n=1 Tax=Linum trigynum TaxID=586398 RepID=A0AAV2FB58_9ROSI